MNDVWSYICRQIDVRTQGRCKMISKHMHDIILGYAKWCESTRRFYPTGPMTHAYYIPNMHEEQKYSSVARLPNGSIVAETYTIDPWCTSCGLIPQLWVPALQQLISLGYRLSAPSLPISSATHSSIAATSFMSHSHNCFVRVAGYANRASIYIDCTVVDLCSAAGSVLPWIKSAGRVTDVVINHPRHGWRFCCVKFINECEIYIGVSFDQPGPESRTTPLCLLHLRRVDQEWTIRASAMCRYSRTIKTEWSSFEPKVVYLHYDSNPVQIIAWILYRTGPPVWLHFLVAFLLDPTTCTLVPVPHLAAISILIDKCVMDESDIFTIDSETTVVVGREPLPPNPDRIVCIVFDQHTPKPKTVCYLNGESMPKFFFLFHTAWRRATDRSIMYTVCYQKANTRILYTYDLSQQGLLVGRWVELD